MGKRIRAQRKGSSPRYKVSSHRFPGKNAMPRENDVVKRSSISSTARSTPRLWPRPLPDGETTMVVATEGVAIGSTIAVGNNVSSNRATSLPSPTFLKERR